MVPHPSQPGPAHHDEPYPPQKPHMTFWLSSYLERHGGWRGHEGRGEVLKVPGSLSPGEGLF